MAEKHIVNSEETLSMFIEDSKERFRKHRYTEYSYENGRTMKQHRALFVWFEQVSELWNAAGVTQKMVLEATKNADFPHTKESLHSFYKHVQKAIKDQTSTKDQSTRDPSIFIEAIQKFSADNWGVVLPDMPAREKAGQV